MAAGGKKRVSLPENAALSEDQQKHFNKKISDIKQKVGGRGEE